MGISFAASIDPSRGSVSLGSSAAAIASSASAGTAALIKTKLNTKILIITLSVVSDVFISFFNQVGINRGLSIVVIRRNNRPYGDVTFAVFIAGDHR